MPLVQKALALFKNVHFQSLLGNGVMAGLGMVTIGMLYRALSINDIGVYVFFMTINNLIDTLKSGFLTMPFVKFYAGTNEERQNEVAGSTWTLAILVTAVLLLLNIPTFFIARHVDDAAIELLLKCFSLVFLSTLPSFMANVVVQAESRFDRLLWLRLINQLLFIATIVVLMVLHRATVSSAIIAFIATNALTSVIIMLTGWTKAYSIKYTTKKTIAEIFHFGKYSMGTSLSSNLFGVTDTIFIKIFLGAPALAIYNLGGRLNQIVEIPMLSFAASGMPALSAYYNQNQKDNLMYTMKKLIGMLSIAIFAIAIVAIIFADPIILLLGGHKYIGSQAPNIFRLFISIAILYPSDRFFALTLDVIHKPKINFYKILVMLAVNLIADYIAISICKSTYSIIMANIFPVLAAIIIAYIPLNKYSKFNFWSIYSVGYKEIVIFIKQTYGTFVTKKAAAKG
ncbi:O-antigen/teichoic acid export membrane protein [Mucilaginibacter gracilis]|uniref:O-antigen/teichoic acid export membrane protein n=1 Tax=Mucilaginibacter gracilis TaxID=423350 RepID=A0A495IXS6_9SPHI|nr:lipopolysaccharide biosynthesis protein [Mucilaginibacter gracilis]RKR80854.1 O-antigen/teichoic acid export membrane protein [Mucilaginibacter gracilis]